MNLKVEKIVNSEIKKLDVKHAIDHANNFLNCLKNEKFNHVNIWHKHNYVRVYFSKRLGYIDFNWEGAVSNDPHVVLSFNFQCLYQNESKKLNNAIKKHNDNLKSVRDKQEKNLMKIVEKIRKENS